MVARTRATATTAPLRPARRSSSTQVKVGSRSSPTVACRCATGNGHEVARTLGYDGTSLGYGPDHTKAPPTSDFLSFDCLRLEPTKGERSRLEKFTIMTGPRNFQLSFAQSFEEADQADREYYWALTPQQRWSLMETLRRRNYGNRATERLLRVLEIAERPQR